MHQVGPCTAEYVNAFKLAQLAGGQQLHFLRVTGNQCPLLVCKQCLHDFVFSGFLAQVPG